MTQSDKEEKLPPTAEVSKPILTSNSRAEPESLWNILNVNALRRRNFQQIGIKSEENIVSETISTDSTYASRESSISETLINKLENAPKSMKYPKIAGSYPKIVDQMKNRIIPKGKKIDPKPVKPPPANPPVFLKCNPKPKKVETSRSREKTEEGNLDTKNLSTDLDIQLSHMQFATLKASNSSFAERSEKDDKGTIVRADSDSQSLKEYCDFNEKKLVRVAPHIRRKDVICDTVDVWSASNDGKSNADLSRYRPLIFGGTFPIDAPSRGNASGALRKTSQTGKNISKTFDIDCPLDYE